MTLEVEQLAHAAATAPEGYALYEKQPMREYIRQRNAFIEHVRKIVGRSDLSAEGKIAAISMHPGVNLR